MKFNHDRKFQTFRGGGRVPYEVVKLDNTISLSLLCMPTFEILFKFDLHLKFETSRWRVGEGGYCGRRVFVIDTPRRFKIGQSDRR